MMDWPFTLLFQGFPGRTNRGFLGWGAIVLLPGPRTGLFDTGGFSERPALIERLAQAGVDRYAIHYIVLSHFHFDHAANLGLFPNATVYLHDREIETLEQDNSSDIAMAHELFPAYRRRIRPLSGLSGVVEGHLWHHTPGHTNGSLTLFVEDQQGQKWALAGDALKNIGEARTLEAAMSTDREASRRSIATILEKADFVVPGHDRVLTVVRGSSGEITGIEAITDTTVRIIMPDGVSLHVSQGSEPGHTLLQITPRGTA